MAPKKEETNTANVMDAFLKGWWNQVDLIEEFEQRSLEAIKSQNEWLNGTREQYCKLEENTKKLTTEWAANVHKMIEDNKIGFNTPNIQELVSKWEEVGHRSQTLAFLPGKTSLDILVTAGDQMERTYARAIGQQQKQRDEFAKNYENAVEQFKQQSGAFNLFPLSFNNLTAVK